MECTFPWYFWMPVLGIIWVLLAGLAFAALIAIVELITKKQ